jgi:hypothetical protein
VERGRAAGRMHTLDELPPLIIQFHTLVAEASGNTQLQIMLTSSCSIPSIRS